MGSLMSGWSSTALGDDKKVRPMRNWSLTKQEVDAFWRQRGLRPQQQDDDGQGLGSPRVFSPLQQSPRNSDQLQRQQESAFEARQLDGRRIVRHISSRSEPSLPAARTEEGFLPENVAAAAERPSTSCDWWTRSNWAFLNEPPHKQEEEISVSASRGSRAPHKACAYDQFHAARIVTGNA